MPTCSACQAANPADARFCVRCGAPLAGEAAANSTSPASSPVNQGRLGNATYRVSGYEMQAVVVNLSAGETVQAEPGMLLYMRGQIGMQTGTGGGVMAGFKRALAGDSFFLSEFSGPGEVAFAAPYPGTIHPVAIGAGETQTWLCQRHSFLCCTPGVTISVAFSQKLSYGMFSGEGFILQKLAGAGQALLHAGGHFIRMELAPGEQIRVDTGSVVAFDSRASYTIEFVKGVKNALFGGEGLFFIVLTGPAVVILQSLSFDRLVSRIAAQAQLSSGQNAGAAVGLGALGGMLGGMLGGGGNTGNW